MTERERVARAIWNTYAKSKIAREGSMGVTWETLLDWAAKSPLLQDLVDTAYAEADAALSAMSPAWRPIPSEVREGEAPWDGEFYETAKSNGAIPFVASWDREDEWCTFNRCYETTIQPVKGVPWLPTHWRRIVMPLPAPPSAEEG